MSLCGRSTMRLSLIQFDMDDGIVTIRFFGRVARIDEKVALFHVAPPVFNPGEFGSRMQHENVFHLIGRNTPCIQLTDVGMHPVGKERVALAGITAPVGFGQLA